MASVIVPLVLKGLFAVLIKQADWAASLGVWVFSVFVVRLSLGCACVSERMWRQAGRLRQSTEAKERLVFPHMPQI